jgi:hypothetical protein
VRAILALLPNSLRTDSVQLHVRMIWAALHFLFYFLIPIALTRVSVLRVSSADLGLRFGATRHSLWIVAVVASVSAPIVLFLSGTEAFRGAYPLYRAQHADAVSIMLWAACFAVYLFSIEAFFRGFLFAMLTPALSRHALLVALLPYVATHRFLPEALGAIPVGILLGILRVRAGSIWPGFFAHLAVALEIELTALYRSGLLQ